MSTTPVLIAPRPVRLTADSPFSPRSAPALAQPARIDFPPVELAAEVVAQRLDAASPKQEVLEEFLSIFRSGLAASPPPSLLVPPSPTAKLRSLFSYRPQPASSLFAVEEVSHPASPAGADDDEIISISTVVEARPLRWFSSTNLSSPISRIHTRNPFQRHPSYDVLPSSRSRPPSSLGRASACVSPANIPLPPTPRPDA